MTTGRMTLIAVTVFLLAEPSRGDESAAATPTFERCAHAQIKLDGPAADAADAVIKNWLLRAPRDNPAILEMFADRDRQPYRDLLPWSGEFAGKLLTGMVQVLRVTGDQQLKAAAADLARGIVDQQADDGYLGPFPAESRLTGKAPNVRGGATWDAWGHYHAMMGLLLWHEESKDDEALACARRIGDLLCAKFPDSGTPVSAMGSTEMNQAVAHSLALLYNRTGDAKHLQGAERVVDDFSAPGAGDYLRMGLQQVEFFQTPKPRWESLHPIMALAELYWITGNDEYRTAFESLWWSIAKLERHNNGGFSSGEKAQGNPYHPGAIETCCTIAWMAMSVEMLRMTGDPLVADELELSTLNQIMGTYDPSGRWSTYNTPMDGRRVPSTVDIAFQIRPGSEELNCCSVNAARGFGLISDWALMRSKEGLVLNWYGPGEITTTVKDTPLVLRQQTKYPADGRIVLEVGPAEPVEFELKLRIPNWSAKTHVAVNGAPTPAQAGTYLTLKRRWQAGDKVQIDLDMSYRFWVGQQQCAEKASVYRGPLLLAYEESHPTSITFSEGWGADADLRIASAAGEYVEFAFEGDSIEWHGARLGDGGRARVSIDDHEIEVVDQYGPGTGANFVWKRTGLGVGAHVLRVEVLGERSPDSRGTKINYYNFRTPATLPEFDARQFASAVASSEDGAIIVVDVEDATGKSVRLRDFATAGQNGTLYSSWLPVAGAPAAEFSKQNPSRTAPLAN